MPSRAIAFQGWNMPRRSDGDHPGAAWRPPRNSFGAGQGTPRSGSSSMTASQVREAALAEHKRFMVEEIERVTKMLIHIADTA